MDQSKATPGTSTSQTHPRLQVVPPAPGGGGVMDREFILKHQIVERYIAGRLPLRGAQDFERFCREHPELLDELGLSERINAGLRLLEAGNLSTPIEQPKARPWQKPALVYSLAGAVLVLIVLALVLASRISTDDRQVQQLQGKLQTRPLEAATSTTSVVLTPSRTAPSRRSSMSFGGRDAEMADMKIDMSWSSYTIFRVTIDRLDQGRVGVIYQAQKDSNGHVHVALNTSALGPGLYQLTLEGLNWRGESSPQAWITVELAHQFNAARGG
ncbi:MAG: hypothetical protein QM718_11095 [Steroidobacteraceae bacterium]